MSEPLPPLGELIDSLQAGTAPANIDLNQRLGPLATRQAFSKKQTRVRKKTFYFSNTNKKLNSLPKLSA